MASRMIQNNFSGGEISPSLFGRSDLQSYYKGAAEIENFIVSKEGTLRKRHGVNQILQLPRSYDFSKIVPYKYDRTEGGFFLLYKPTYPLDACRVELYTKEGTKRSWTEEGSTVDYKDITNFTGSVKDFQYKQIGDEVWISNESVFRVLKVTTTSSSSPMSSSKFDIETWQQSAVPDSIPYGTDTTTTCWKATPSVTSTARKIYYGIYGVKDSVISPLSKQAVNFTKTWGANTYIDIEVRVAIGDVSKWDYIMVSKRTGGNFGELARFYMSDDPESTTESQYIWNFRDENHTPSDVIYGQTNVLGSGFTTPLCVDCFQQRRVFANASNSSGKFPMTLWFSETGNLDNFYADRPSADDDPFSPTIASSGPAFILWTVCYQEMMILFTESGLYSVGFSQQQGFSASSCRISKFSNLAASPSIQPVVTEAGIVFVGADNKTCYSVSYDLQENMMKPINRSVLTEHLTRTAYITGIGLQDYPDNVVWVSTSDGKVCTFTIEKNEGVYSWSHSRIANANILDVIGLGTCTDSTTDRTYGDILFVVEKGNNHYVCAPTEYYHDFVGGSSSNVVAKLTTLRPESQEKTIVGANKNVKDVLLRVYQTGGLSVRSTYEGNLPLVPAALPSGLYTGDVKIMPRGAINESGQIEVVSDNDSACEILQIVYSMEVDG